MGKCIPLIDYNWQEYRFYCEKFDQKEIIKSSKKSNGKIKQVSTEKAYNWRNYEGNFRFTEKYHLYDKERAINRAYYLMVFYGVKSAVISRNKNMLYLHLYIPNNLRNNPIIKQFYFGEN